MPRIALALMLVSLRALAQDVRSSPGALAPALLSASHFGSSPFAPATATDTKFVVDRGPGLDTGCTFRTEGPLRFTIPINRVVGEVNADGTLVNPQALVNSGVVSAFATLRLPAFDIDFDAAVPPPFQPERDQVLFNGADVGGGQTFLTGSNNTWKLNEFRIPIEKLRFGRRNPGGTPTAGQNQIEIDIDVANAPLGEELWCTAIDWAELSFDALAPVIMVHGNNSSGAFFSDFNFIQPFQQQKIPFDNSINMATANIVDHGDLLGGLIPQKAAEFGAKHVHLVVHSKGGLDSRDFLARTLPPNFGVLSLTTMATPHHGSVGADYDLDAQNANAAFSDNTTRVLLAQQVTPDEGTRVLRVSAVEAFNQQNLGLLPSQLTVDEETKAVVYQSISDDANLDNSSSGGHPTITIDETRGTGQGGKPDFVWVRVMNQVYRLMGEVATTRLEPRTINVLGKKFTVMVVRETPTPGFQLNDFLVTVNSARLTGFRELASIKSNHATIASPATAQTVINSIKTAQPVH